MAFPASLQAGQGDRLADTRYRFELQDAKLRFHATGDWSITYVSYVDGDLRRLPDEAGDAREAVIDLSELTRLDTAGAFVLDRLMHEFEA
jgi:hypothetical protein